MFRMTTMRVIRPAVFGSAPLTGLHANSGASALASVSMITGADPVSVPYQRFSVLS